MNDDPEADDTPYAHPAWWRGQEQGVAGACMRWREALSKPIPHAGVMHEPLETLYRETEALRVRVEAAEKEAAWLRDHMRLIAAKAGPAAKRLAKFALRDP